MPRFDRTGPNGQGPLTGRGLGPCGRGIGFRQGFGRGFNFRQPQLTKKEEKEILEQELELTRQDIKAIEERLKKLK